MARPEMVGPASIALGQGVGAFISFLPKLSDIRRANPDKETELAADVRLGEVAAATLTVGMGIIVSSLTGSSVPAFVAVIVAGIMVCIYETALRSGSA